MEYHGKDEMTGKKVWLHSCKKEVASIAPIAGVDNATNKIVTYLGLNGTSMVVRDANGKLWDCSVMQLVEFV